MGACEFYSVAEGPTVKAAFSTAIDNARYDYGHAGYTGTIAEKDSVELVGEAESLSQAYDMAHAMIEADDPRVSDKWGPAGAISINNTDKYLFFGWASS